MSASLPESTEYRIPTFEEYLRGGNGAAAPVPVYAHPMDRAIIERLSRSALQHPINRFIELAMRYVFTPLILNSIPVGPRAFPELNDLRSDVAAILGIPVPEIYVNALPWAQIGTVGTDEEAMIVVDTTYEHLATREEMLFVLGHESGHIQNQHVTYRVLV